MKKTVIILSAVLALVACNKETPANLNEGPIDASKVVFNFNVNYPSDTKAVKPGWEAGDKVFIFFDGVTTGYVSTSFNGSAWTPTYNGSGVLSASGTLTAVYLPYGSSATPSYSSSWTFDTSYSAYYMVAEKVDYTISNTSDVATLSATLNMVAPEGFVQFAMPLSGTVNETATTFFRTTSTYTYTLSDSHIKPVSFASVAGDGTITTTEGSYGAAITGYVYGGDINFSGVLNSSFNGIETTYAFTFKNDNGTIYDYDDVTYLLSGIKTFSYKSAIKFPAISSSAWKVPAPSYVEINGVKWAKWNIGATAEGGYGDYFAWGATYPQAKYEISDYREFSISGNLPTGKDVACQKLGTTDWHMPTEEDINSIFNTSTGNPADGVTWSWISNTSTYGTTGYEVYLTSDSSKKIFLPAAGYWNDVLGSAGVLSGYWSTKFYDAGNCYYLYFLNGSQSWLNSGRIYGLPVRPVHN